MQDATEIGSVEFEYHGVKVEKTRTFITEYGEVYIGLLVRGCWVNIHSKSIHEYIKDKKHGHNLVGLTQQEHRQTTCYS